MKRLVQLNGSCLVLRKNPTVVPEMLNRFGPLLIALMLVLGCAGASESDVRAPRAALAVAALPASPRAQVDHGCVVARLIDGDTFVCADGTRVRLLTVNALERGRGAYADSATRLLGRLMPVGSTVRLDLDVQERDRYGRLLAYVYAGDLFVNRELVRRGMVHVAVYPPNVREVDVLRAAADSARAERLGLWADDHAQH
jgi:micrococcal nuclease